MKKFFIYTYTELRRNISGYANAFHWMSNNHTYEAAMYMSWGSRPRLSYTNGYRFNEKLR